MNELGGGGGDKFHWHWWFLGKMALISLWHGERTWPTSSLVLLKKERILEEWGFLFFPADWHLHRCCSDCSTSTWFLLRFWVMDFSVPSHFQIIFWRKKIVLVSRARFSAKVPHGKLDIYQKVACFFLCVCGWTSMIRTPHKHFAKSV